MCIRDRWEKAYIYEFNTLAPNGYNLTEGGDGNSTKHTAEYKLNKSKQMRKNHADKGLDMYVKWTRTSKGTEGYIVTRPGFKSAQFCSPSLSMEEKLQLANDYARSIACLLYTSDAADERSSVDLGGRR